jgi:hypothetical protein
MPSDVDGGRTTKGKLRQNETGIRKQALTQSAVVSPARTFQSPERARALAASAAAYGRNTGDLLANYDPVTSSWKTSQLCLIEGLTSFSETWPRSGTMRNGIAYQLPPLVPLTGGTGYGSWPTPRREDSEQTGGHRGKPDTLTAPARTWPTPTVQDAENNAGPSQYKRNSLPLNAAIGGALNPMWVEWLMGFPLGWTALEPSATPSSRKSPSF